VITRILIAGVAIAALSGGAASAHKSRHHARHGAGLTYAAPEQPIPYAELDHYLRASPAERRSIAAAANTGGAANASATTSDTTAPAPAPEANPPAATPDNGAVNPPSTMGGAAGGGTSNGAMPHNQPR
jgi:hypothetical protein